MRVKVGGGRQPADERRHSDYRMKNKSRENEVELQEGEEGKPFKSWKRINWRSRMSQESWWGWGGAIVLGF